MKSSWKKQRLATKKQCINSIRYKKKVLNNIILNVTPFNRFIRRQMIKVR